MSQENVETVRRANQALKRGDREAALADYHPDAVWHDLAHAPDSAERVQGLPALRAIWDQWEQAFDELSADIDELIDAGRYVVAMTRWRARGKGSGVVIDVYQADVFQVDGGKVTSVTLGYPDKRTALKAVGLAE
jgi:uncharacterized protein